MDEKYRQILRGFFLGDAYGRGTPTEDPPLWTENGDLVVCIMAMFTVPEQRTLADRITEWTQNGISEIEKPRDKMSTVAERILTDPRWHADPRSVALGIHAAESVASINLPVASSVAFLFASPDYIPYYTKMFVGEHTLTCSVAQFYCLVMRRLIETQHPEPPEETIASIVTQLQMILPAETLQEWTRSTIAELDLGSRPFYAMTTAKVICYALRIVYYARTHRATPDCARVIALISAAGSDTSTNCAVAVSVLCAGCHAIAGFDSMWIEIGHRLWLTERIDAMVATSCCTR